MCTKVLYICRCNERGEPLQNNHTDRAFKKLSLPWLNNLKLKKIEKIIEVKDSEQQSIFIASNNAEPIVAIPNLQATINDSSNVTKQQTQYQPKNFPEPAHFYWLMIPLTVTFLL